MNFHIFRCCFSGISTRAKIPSQQWEEKRIEGDEQINNNCKSTMTMALKCVCFVLLSIM